MANLETEVAGRKKICALSKHHDASCEYRYPAMECGGKKEIVEEEELSFGVEGAEIERIIALIIWQAPMPVQRSRLDHSS